MEKKYGKNYIKIKKNHTVKEIYQDFYLFLAEHFTPQVINIENQNMICIKIQKTLKIVFDYQNVFLGIVQEMKLLYSSIKEQNLKMIKVNGIGFFVNDINGVDNILSQEFNIKDINKRVLTSFIE